MIAGRNTLMTKPYLWGDLYLGKQGHRLDMGRVCNSDFSKAEFALGGAPKFQPLITQVVVVLQPVAQLFPIFSNFFNGRKTAWQF